MLVTSLLFFNFLYLVRRYRDKSWRTQSFGRKIINRLTYGLSFLTFLFLLQFWIEIELDILLKDYFSGIFCAVCPEDLEIYEEYNRQYVLRTDNQDAEERENYPYRKFYPRGWNKNLLHTEQEALTKGTKLNVWLGQFIVLFLAWFFASGSDIRTWNRQFGDIISFDESDDEK